MKYRREEGTLGPLEGDESLRKRLRLSKIWFQRFNKIV